MVRRSTAPLALARLLAGTVAALLCLTACTSSAVSSESGPLPRELKTSEPTTAQQAWSVSLQPVSGLVVFKDVVTLYTVSDGRLTLRAFDGKDGSPLWHHRAAPGGVRPSESAVQPVGVTLDSDRGALVYVAPPEGGAEQTFDVPTRLVAVDAETGEEISRSKPLSLASSPRFCEVAEGVCVDAWFGADKEFTRMRFDAASGQVSELEVGINGSADAAGIGVRILEDDIRVVRVEDGEESWTRSAHELLDSTPPGGARGASNAEEGWTYLTVRPGAVHHRGERITTSLESHIGVLLDLQTGEVRWRGEGYAPCPHGLYHVAVRCRASGTQTVMPEGGMTYSGLDLTVEGFDPTTGRTTWQVPLGNDESVLVEDVPYSLEGRTLITTAQGIRELDPETGTLSAVAPGTYLCEETPTFSLRLPWQAGYDGEQDWHGSHRHRTCDETGAFVQGEPGIESLQGAALETAGLHVVAMHDELVAYRLR